MRNFDAEETILRFFRDDIGGILITDETGEVLYDDDITSFVKKEKTSWRNACPAPREGQKAEKWDFMHAGSGKAYMVISSTVRDEDGLIQIHLLVDTSVYMSLYRDISEYSRWLRTEKDHDGMTGLYNKNKFMAMTKTLFRNQEAIAVFNMDVNDLKHTNDTFGHEAGDRLIRKAAESLKMIEARNVMPFRVGGDEFIVVAIHVSRQEAEQILRNWREALDSLNRRKDGIHCEIACGFAFGEKGYDLEEVFAEADRRMYEDKKARKRKADS